MSARRGKISVYGAKTRQLQRKLSFESFGLSFKDAKIFKYLGPVDGDGIDDIACKVFYESPEKAYDLVPVDVPIGLEPMPEMKMDFSRFGLFNPMSDEITFRMHIDDFQTVGRDVIIGDVFEIPFFENDGGALYEVSDVDLKSSYEKFIAIIHANPISASKENASLGNYIDRDNGDIMDIIGGDADEQYADIVPTDDLTVDGEPPVEKPVDYRKKKQKDFLDDPETEF